MRERPSAAERNSRKPPQKKRRHNAESRVMLKAEEMYEKKEKSEVYASDFFVHNGRGEDRLSSEAVRNARKAVRGRTKQPRKPPQKKRRNNAESRVMLKAEEGGRTKKYAGKSMRTA